MTTALASSSPFLAARREAATMRLRYLSLAFFCVSTALVLAGFVQWIQAGIPAHWSSALIAPAIFYCVGHFARMVRLGIIIGNVRVRSLFMLYLHVATLTFLVPFKLGDLFRINELGWHTGSHARGFLIVWVERAFDMFALGTIIFLSLNHGAQGLVEIAPFLWLMGIFVFGSICFFFIIPEQLPALNLHVMRTYSGEKAIRTLRVLGAVSALCRSGIQLLAGRFATVFLVTVVIWGFEVAAFSLLLQGMNLENSVFDLLRYYSGLISRNVAERPFTNQLLAEFTHLKVLLIIIPGVLTLPLYVSRRVRTLRDQPVLSHE